MTVRTDRMKRICCSIHGYLQVLRNAASVKCSRNVFCLLTLFRALSVLAVDESGLGSFIKAFNSLRGLELLVELSFPHSTWRHRLACDFGLLTPFNRRALVWFGSRSVLSQYGYPRAPHLSDFLSKEARNGSHSHSELKRVLLAIFLSPWLRFLLPSPSKCASNGHHRLVFVPLLSE